MTDAAQFERLLRAIKPIVDRHAESKDVVRYGGVSTAVLNVPMLPREIKELRSAFEPFRDQYKS